MEPPARTDSESIRDEKVKVLKAMPPLELRIGPGTVRGYRNEPGVAKESQSRNLRGLAAGDRLLALERCPNLHPRGQMPARDLHGDRFRFVSRPPCISARVSNRTMATQNPS